MKTVIAINDFDDSHKKIIVEKLNDITELLFLDQFVSDSHFSQAIANADIVAGWPKPELIINSTVKFVQIGSSGWDAFENKGLAEKGIRLATARGVYSIGVAEVGIAMMFALARNFHQHWLDKLNGIFKRHEPYGEIYGSIACIVGVGEIGSTLAQMCNGLNMKVIAVDNHKRNLPYVDQWFSADQLTQAIGQAEHVFITISGNVANHKLFNREVLDHLKPESCIYNMSRGSTIDQKVLIEYLKNGRIKGAGLDVTDPEPPEQTDELFSLDNVILTGHSGGLSAGWKRRMIDLMCDNIIQFSRGQKLRNELNWKSKKIIE